MLIIGEGYHADERSGPLGLLLDCLCNIVVALLMTGPIPKHVALIMDGNRRYAKLKKLQLEQGHSAGAKALVEVLEVAYRLGVNDVTIYAFSIENFNRSQEEVDTLLGMLRNYLKVLSSNELLFAQINKVQIKIIGNKTYIPADILSDLDAVELKTSHACSLRVLNVCFPYTTRDDICQLVRAVVQSASEGGGGGLSKISLQKIHDNFYFGPKSPPLDLLIRTSGHTRLSDFMLWQCNHNCVVEFTKTLWPNFGFWCFVLIIFKWAYYQLILGAVSARPPVRRVKGKKPKTIAVPYSTLPPAPNALSVCGL